MAKPTLPIASRNEQGCQPFVPVEGIPCFWPGTNSQSAVDKAIRFLQIVLKKLMQSQATTPEQYLAELPDDRKEAIQKLREAIGSNLPEGFEEGMGYGMIAYYVPHSLYPAGYHVDPKVPLPFINLASQKNHIAVYHSGIYANGELMQWFTEEYPKHSTRKLDMGKSCIRFKKPEHIPYALFAELAKKVTPQEWIATYESVIKR